MTMHLTAYVDILKALGLLPQIVIFRSIGTRSLVEPRYQTLLYYRSAIQPAKHADRENSVNVVKISASML